MKECQPYSLEHVHNSSRLFSNIDLKAMRLSILVFLIPVHHNFLLRITKITLRFEQYTDPGISALIEGRGGKGMKEEALLGRVFMEMKQTLP